MTVTIPPVHVDPAPPPPDDREDAVEYRAYLQRGETRLSTLHRVAGAFLSGAGLLTLLPVLLSSTFTTLLAGVVFFPATGFPPPASLTRWLTLGSVCVTL